MKKTLLEYMEEMDEMRQIDSRLPLGNGNSDDMMILDQVKGLAEHIARARGVSSRDGLYLIKKVLDKVLR